MADDDVTCPRCGSIDVCQDWGSGQNRGKHGWVCDHCGHEWDMEES